MGLWRNQRLEIHEIAPDVTVANASGESIRLASLWKEKPAVLLFLRHFG